MKKPLIALALFLLPLLSLAQDDAVVYSDFAKKIKDIKTFRLNEGINITAINVDNQTFDVTAIDENLNTVWRTSINGYLLAIAKFKGKIIAISSSGGDAKGNTGNTSGNTYSAALLDPKTGSKIVEKTIFEGTADFATFPKVLIDRDEFYGLGTRKSNYNSHTTMLERLAMKQHKAEDSQTQEMNYIQFDDNLNEVSRIKPTFDPNGKCIDWMVNSNGDVFICWLINNYINIYRYENGKAQPTKAKIDIYFPDGFFDRDPNVSFAVSEINRNIINCALFFFDDDKKNTLWVGKIDMVNGKTNSVTEVFDSGHRKELEKAFVKPNKKINSPDIGAVKTLDVRGFLEVDGKLMLAIASSYNQASSIYKFGYDLQNTLIINVYDESLGLKFQQLFPSKGIYVAGRLPFGFNVQKNKLTVTGVDYSGASDVCALYGTLDLGTGQWDKMYRLSKKKIPGKAYPNGPAALWFNNSFYLPYMEVRDIVKLDKYNVFLQQNTYNNGYSL